MQKAVSFNNVAIVYVKGRACRIHFWYISKDDAINMMNNASLIEKKNYKIIKKKLLCIYKSKNE